MRTVAVFTLQITLSRYRHNQCCTIYTYHLGALKSFIHLLKREHPLRSSLHPFEVGAPIPYKQLSALNCLERPVVFHYAAEVVVVPEFFISSL